MILRHRDRELLRFEWTGLEGVRIVPVNDAGRQFLPLGVRDVVRRVGSRKKGSWEVLK